MGLYQPITRYLNHTQGNSVRLTFQEIEGIINRALPRSAYRHREWWANNPSGHSHARSWVEAGWRTEKVDLEQRELVFSRERKTGGAPVPKNGNITDPFGAMRGSVKFMPGVDLTEPTGERWEAETDDSNE